MFFLWRWLSLWLDRVLFRHIPREQNRVFAAIFSCIKWYLHWISGWSELRRLSSDPHLHRISRDGETLPTVQLVVWTKRSLECSKRLREQAAGLNVKESIAEIASIKHIPTATIAYSVFAVSLKRISQLYRLQHEARRLSSEPFSPANPDHMLLLRRLWRGIFLKETVPAIPSPRWKEVGFQGDNPATDFRGMGMFGLLQLVFFVENSTAAAKRCHQEASYGVYWYSFAIVGINISDYICACLLGGQLDRLVLGHDEELSLDLIHNLYCVLFERFHHTWVGEKPRDVMEFNRIFKNVKGLWWRDMALSTVQ